MNFLRTFFGRFANAIRSRRKKDSDLDEEIRSTLEMLTEQKIREGMAAAEAARAARIELGGAEQVKESVRASRSGAWLGTIAQDIRFALRMLRKSRSFAVTCILTLSLGIAAAVAIFGFVDAALIRPLPYANPARLLAVGETSPRVSPGMSGYSYLNYVDMARSNRVFASAALYQRREFVIANGGSLSAANGIGVTANFLGILGVAPAMGKDFEPIPAGEDLQSLPTTAILSYAAWQKWFGGRPDALGKTIVLSHEPYTVIGVLPRGFEFGPAGNAEFWTTLRPFAGEECSRSRGCTAFSAMARLKDGATLQQALADVQRIAAQEAALHPNPDKYRSASVGLLSESILGDMRPTLLALLGGVALLVLIAYVNVAGLVLVGSENRRREFAVRGVLGASGARLMQQLLAEGLVVALLSGALGIVAAALTRELVLKVIPTDTLESAPYLRASWNWHVAGFAIAPVLMALILFAVTPFVRIPLANLRSGLVGAGGGATGAAWRRLGAKLVVLELATTMVLLAGAGLLGKSLYRLLQVDVGFEPSHLATIWMEATDAKYSNDQQTLLLHRQIIDRIGSLPGVAGVGLANGLPMNGPGNTQLGFVEKPDLGNNNEAGHRWVNAGFLSVLRARLLAGRFFNTDDEESSAPPVAIVNQTLAGEYFPGENPIGKGFYYWKQGSIDGPRHPTRIVGVIADIKEGALDSSPRAIIYTPSPAAEFSVVVRTLQEPTAILPSLSAAVHGVDPSILMSDATTMTEIIQGSWSAYMHRVLAWFAGAFAGFALLLSAIGIYGVIAYSVSRRTREIGVRMALGATPHSVYRLVLGETGWLAVVGLAIGGAGALMAGTLMRKLLFGVPFWDTPNLCVVVAVVSLSALLAGYLPARRAARVHPADALRSE